MASSALSAGVFGALGLAACLYLCGLTRWRRSHRGSRPVVPPLRVASFVAGLVFVAVGIGSPVHGWSESLFSAHMAQHLLFVFVGAPLVALGRPGLVWRMALPARVRRRLSSGARSRPGRLAGRLVRQPVCMATLYAAVFWTWHMPGAFQAAVHDESIHTAEHASFLLVALAFWTLVLAPKARRKLGYGEAVALVFPTLLQSVWLAATLILAPAPVYPGQSRGAGAWGLTALEDQQIAGLIMWVPVDLVLFATLAVLFLRWLAELDTKAGSRAAAPASQARAAG